MEWLADIDRQLKARRAADEKELVLLRQAVKTEKIRCLEFQCLLRELKTLVADTSSQGQNRELLKQLKEAIECTEVAQRLKLRRKDQDATCLSNMHVLGVTPEKVLALLPKANYNLLYPLLEARLAQKSALLNTKFRSLDLYKGPPDADKMPLDQLVAYLDPANVRDRAGPEGTMARLLEAVKKYLMVVQEAQQLLSNFLQEHVLDRQSKLDQAHVVESEALATTLLAKVQTMEKQIMTTTYSRENIAALQHIHDMLHKDVEETKRQMDRKMAELAAYEALGEPFRIKVAEYAKLSKQLATAQGTLQQYMQLQRELDGRGA